MDFVSYYIQQISIRRLGPLRFQVVIERCVLIIGRCVLIVVSLLNFSLYYLDNAVYISCNLCFNIIASIFWVPSSSLASWYSGTWSTLLLVPLSFILSSESPAVILMCFLIYVTCDFYFLFQCSIFFLFCIFNVLSIL